MAKNEPDQSEWFEISDRDWLDPRFRGKKLKLIADAQVPGSIVAEMRAAKIAVDALDSKVKTRPDPYILTFAQKKGRVLLTLDRDFWDDRHYPLQTVRTGIIYIAEPPDQHDQILRAFGLVYGCFAKSYPLDWWNAMKVRATVGEFEIKMRTWAGRVTRYKMRLQKGRLMASELEGRNT